MIYINIWDLQNHLELAILKPRPGHMHEPVNRNASQHSLCFCQKSLRAFGNIISLVNINQTDNSFTNACWTNLFISESLSSVLCMIRLKLDGDNVCGTGES